MSTSTEISSPENGTAKENGQAAPGQREYPSGFKLCCIMTVVYLSMLSFAIGHTILATAIPTITSEFHCTEDIGWYVGAFSIANCACQMVFSRLYTLLSTKWTFIIAVAVFQLGFIICGAAPSSPVFIIGRAISGVGGGGLMTGVVVITADTVPLSRRAIYIGALGTLWSVGSVVAPLLGGALTTHVSWRWCFYILPPIGAIIVVLAVLSLPASIPTGLEAGSWMSKVQQFDPIGTVLFAGTWICLLFAVQWGGTRYPWDHAVVVALLVLFVVLLMAWVASQWLFPKSASLPLYIFRQRTVACTALYTFTGCSVFVIVLYYLPIWFQAIKNDSAFDSGIHNLPIIISDCLGCVIAGVGTSMLGYYTPFMIGGAILMAIGTGLLLMFRLNTPVGMWIGYQIICGIGTGIALEQPITAVQTVLPERDIVAGSTLIIFCRSLSMAISVAIAQNVFNTHVTSGLTALQLNVSPDVILGAGMSKLRDNLEQMVSENEDVVEEILRIYNSGIRGAFIVALALSCVAAVVSLGIEWRSVKGDGDEASPPAGNSGEEKKV